MRLRYLTMFLLSAFLLAACGAGDEPAATDNAGSEQSAPASSSERASASSDDTAATLSERIAAAAEGAHRSDASIARNDDRNPVETLTFFGLRPDMTVVEVWPGGGWYTEVLAPVLRDEGKLVAASYPEDGEVPYRARTTRAFREKLAEHPEAYSAVETVAYAPPEHAKLGPPASADMVLLSRHFHNFIRGGITEQVLQAAYEVLRPGGILAVVQHRALEDAVPEAEHRDGYVRESLVIEQVKQAGFALDARSDINANPKDTRDHEMGVWQLLPSLRKCRSLEGPAEREACEKEYRAIGESDRMTLRFIKPQ